MKNIYFLIFPLLLSACSIVGVRQPEVIEGYLPHASLRDNIVIGMSQTQVSNLLGTPSQINADGAWVYLARSNDSETIETFVIEYDAEGLVSQTHQ